MGRPQHPAGWGRFFYDQFQQSRLGELPEGGTKLAGHQYKVQLRPVSLTDLDSKKSRLFRVLGLEHADLKVSGEVYLAEDRRSGSTIYRLFRTQNGNGGKRVIESILLEPKQFANR